MPAGNAHRILGTLYDAFTAGIGPGIVRDPGNAGTITFTKWGQICEMTSGGSGETRTLANPNRSGVMATVRLGTDGGGDVVLTASNGLNQGGDTVATFADAGDRLTLLSVGKEGSAGTYRWDVLDGNVGTAVSSASTSSSPSTSPSASVSSSPSAT